MKRLIIVSSPENNQGSIGYLNKIRKIQKSEYPSIEIMETKCKTQEDLNTVLNMYDGKVLILRPSSLILPHEHIERNVENYQVVDAIMSYMTPSYKTTDKILLMGYGNVGKRVLERLVEDKWCTTVARSNVELTNEFVQNFDLIINCTNCREVGFYYSGAVIDVAGNWITSTHSKMEQLDGVVVQTKYIPQTNIISCGKIGTLTTRMMLEEV